MILPASSHQGGDDPRIAGHLRTLADCNQRGGRLLSLVDLLEAGTVNLPLAGYLAAVMRRGSSLLVGARPGGAGKTAVMVALLNLRLQMSRCVRSRSGDAAGGVWPILRLDRRATWPTRSGKGWYYAYLWDDQARAFFELAGRGLT